MRASRRRDGHARRSARAFAVGHAGGGSFLVRRERGQAHPEGSQGALGEPARGRICRRIAAARGRQRVAGGAQGRRRSQDTPSSAQQAQSSLRADAPAFAGRATSADGRWWSGRRGAKPRGWQVYAAFVDKGAYLFLGASGGSERRSRTRGETRAPFTALMAGSLAV